jgi:hypothetical protein
MRFFRFMGVTVLVAMGCAQEEQSNDAGLDDTEQMPSDGGSSAGKTTGGSPNKAGGSSIAGKPSGQAGTAGQAGSSGGESGGESGGGKGGKTSGGSGGTAGKAAGGNGGTGGKATGGSGGKASGGSAGTGGVGPCKPSNGAAIPGLSLRYESEVNDATGTSIGAQLSIYNTSSNTFNLADLRVRYYLSNEVAVPLETSINSAWLRSIAGGQTDIESKLQLDVVDSSCSVKGADTYFEFTFKADAGLLEPQHDVLFSWVASNGATQNFDQSDDYSFSAAQKIGSDYSKVVLLQNNLNRLWGTEP